MARGVNDPPARPDHAQALVDGLLRIALDVLDHLIAERVVEAVIVEPKIEDVVLRKVRPDDGRPLLIEHLYDAVRAADRKNRAAAGSIAKDLSQVRV